MGESMRIVRVVWPFLALAVAVGCSDAAKSSKDETPRQGENDMGPPVVPADAGPDALPADMGEPVPGMRELKPEEPLDRIVFLGQTASFKVQYVASDGRPIANARIEGAILDPMTHNPVANNERDGTRLRAQVATTDAMGWATLQVQAGMLNTQLELRASADAAADVFWRVTVQRQGAGGVRIKVTYDDQTGRYPFGQLDHVDLSLFNLTEMNQTCAALAQSPTALPPAYLAVPIHPFDPTHNETLIDDLNDGARFAVAAQVTGTAGGVVAFGCADAVTVTGGQVTSVTIPVTDLPLNYKGRYEVVNKFRMTDLLRNSGNQTLEIVGQVLDVLRIVGGGDVDGEHNARGNALIHLFCDLVNIGEGTCDIVSRLGAGLIERLLNNPNLVPPEVLRVLNVVGDVLAIAEDMTVVGEIEFTSSAPGPDGIITGSDNRWQKFRFNWRNGCPNPGMCQREFTIGDLDVERRPIAGVFDAEVVGQDVHIRPHSLNIKYGVILLGIAEQWIIPAIVGQPGPITLQDLLTQLLPCHDINDFFGDPNSGLCEDVLVAALSEAITDQISRLDIDVNQFVLEGHVKALDTDGDLTIDTLADGDWDGLVNFSDSAMVPFDGCFNGCRDMECPMECTVPAP
jgi:hypothetical protein